MKQSLFSFLLISESFNMDAMQLLCGNCCWYCWIAMPMARKQCFHLQAGKVAKGRFVVEGKHRPL